MVLQIRAVEFLEGGRGETSQPQSSILFLEIIPTLAKALDGNL